MPTTGGEHEDGIVQKKESRAAREPSVAFGGEDVEDVDDEEMECEEDVPEPGREKK